MSWVNFISFIYSFANYLNHFNFNFIYILITFACSYCCVFVSGHVLQFQGCKQLVDSEETEQIRLGGDQTGRCYQRRRHYSAGARNHQQGSQLA